MDQGDVVLRGRDGTLAERKPSQMHEKRVVNINPSMADTLRLAV